MCAVLRERHRHRRKKGEQVESIIRCFNFNYYVALLRRSMPANISTPWRRDRGTMAALGMALAAHNSLLCVVLCCVCVCVCVCVVRLT